MYPRPQCLCFQRKVNNSKKSILQIIHICSFLNFTVFRVEILFLFHNMCTSAKWKRFKIQRDNLILTKILIFRYIRFNTFHSWISLYMTNYSTDMFWLFTEKINEIYILTGTAREIFFLHGSITNSWTCSIRMPD